jgi:regulator of protease activity HflC (stomatin/prohibitin superfamily)
MKPEQQAIVVGGVVGTIILISLFLLLSPVKIINTGNKGVVYYWGAVSDTVLDEGIAWRMPIKTKIKEISIQPREIENKIDVGSSGAITKDNQTIGCSMNVFYSYNKEHLVPMLTSYGETNMASIVSKTITEVFKKTIGDYSIFDVAAKQEEIKNSIFEQTKSELSQYPVLLNEIKINNYDWSEQFDSQIETTMAKAQQVKQAEQDLLVTQQQAQKQVKEAEAQKQALITKAEGEKEAAALMAEAKSLQGEGIKKYNQALAANLEIELKIRQLEIDKIKAEKWTGQLVPSQVFTPIPLDLNGTMRELESVK